METAAESSIVPLLAAALEARASLFDPQHETALRLFNGFVEGQPALVADLYGKTLLLHDAADPSTPADRQRVQTAQAFYRERLPWLSAVVVKTRAAADPQARKGALVYGDQPDRKVCENGLWYALDLLLNRDASLYLDTRRLRTWIKDHAAGRSALNAFAYTGSLGVAACAGGASRVVQLDLSRAFLNLAKTSYTLNGFPIQKSDFIAGDFWTEISALKRRGALFDCVFLDPPFFSTTPHGRVDLVHQNRQVINKVRPLVAHQGYLVAINNALFVSGAEYMRLLESLCADGYLAIEELIPVPEDFTGYPHTRARPLPADPAPFNHSTKIAVLRVTRKDILTPERMQSAEEKPKNEN